MLSNEAKRQIADLFEKAIEADRRRIYFDRYHSAQTLEGVNLAEEFSKELNPPEMTEVNIDLTSARLLESNGDPILFISQRDGIWSIIYSSLLDSSTLNNLRRLSKHKGWLLNAWIPGEIVDQIYEEFCPEEQSIRLTRDWEPYHLYKRNPKVPDELQQYFAENEREFAEQGVEIQIDSPKWLLEESLNDVMTPFLKERAETSESSFIMEAPPEMGIKTDGGVMSHSGGAANPLAVQSRVVVQQDAQITHSSGDIGATFRLVDEATSRALEIYDDFEGLSTDRRYEGSDNGVFRIAGYEPPKTLKVTLEGHEFDEKSSIKLSNFLSVGQKEVDIYGIIAKRDGLSFNVETHLPFNGDTYDITVTKSEGNTTLYIRPTRGSTTGLVYLYRKIQEKIHPSIDFSRTGSAPELDRG